jgi:hypothetical protein
MQEVMVLHPTVHLPPFGDDAKLYWIPLYPTAGYADMLKPFLQWLGLQKHKSYVREGP